MSLIRFDHVVKKFEGREVLSGVSFSVEKGEILAVVGPSGTGKSVTLKHLVRLLTPTSGSVWLDDVEISSATGWELEAIRNRFGYLFQGGALLGWLTVEENVALPLREHGGLTEDEIDARVKEALAAVELSDAADRYPAEISGGMQKRAGLARAIVRRNDIDQPPHPPPQQGARHHVDRRHARPSGRASLRGPRAHAQGRPCGGGVRPCRVREILESRRAGVP